MSDNSLAYLFLQVMGFLLMSAIFAYMFKNAGKQAEHLYRIEHPASCNEESRVSVISRKERNLKIFLGIAFWLMIGMAGIYAYILVRSL